MKRLFGFLIVLVVLFAFGSSNNILPRFPSPVRISENIKNSQTISERKNVIEEESAVISAIDKTLPSVVTIGISKTSQSPGSIEIDPFNPFSPFRQVPGRKQLIEQNIGSGFIITSDGLIVTNKHVVSDTHATYNVVTNDNKSFDVQKISRDPLNDLAILKIDANNLSALELGSSSKLKLGQYVIAIGTPLGEFQNTVTTGVVSGLKRGITAGSPFEGYVEQLDNVIQTDAAISAGNSGGPLINLSGQAIGVNTAVSAQGQNIGFAIPIDIVSELIENFNKSGGKIERPFLGIRYQMIAKREAILNEIVEGAYIMEVVENSPAQKAGLLGDDILVEFDGKKITGEDEKILQKLIASKKIGSRVTVKIWREGKILDKTILLTTFD